MNKYNNEIEQQGSNEGVEEAEVVFAHAVIYPITVVVKLIYAFVANVTVPRIFRVSCLAIRT